MVRLPASDVSKDIGRRMQKILKELKITQAEAAGRLGLASQPALNNYLIGRNETPVTVIKRFSKEFNTPFDVLMGNEDIGNIHTDDNSAFLTIIQALDEFLAQKKLRMNHKNKAMIFSHFYQIRNKDKTAENIKAELSAMQFANPDLFQ